MKQLLLAITAMVCSCHAMSIAPSMEFEHNASIVANDIYNVFWSVDDTTATFEVHVKTLGYVGFGISKTGGMRDADIVIGWVKDGKAYFQDRYSSRNGEPEIDESQDWKLEEGREEGEYTILRFSRSLRNCDPFDVDITQDTMRIIYSFHERDPKESSGLTYHGSKNRGTKSLSLVNYETPSAKMLPPDAFHIDLHFDKVEVPAKDTTYYCRGFRVPKLDKKHHVVMVEPLVQPGHEGLVHHFVVLLCPKEFNDTKYETMNGECLAESMKEISVCNHMVFAYAVGAGPMYMPEDVGFPLAGSDFPQFFRLEIHYDNPPPSQSGLIDSSGMRIWLTPTLRKYDAGLLLVGMTFDDTHVIPPNFKDLHNEAYCSEECLSQLMGTTSEIQVFSALLHTHLLGTGITMRHVRNHTELPPIVADKYYDFNFQEFRQLKKEVTIKQGDELIVECQYRSDKRTGLTFGGQGTRDEMCFVFLLFYPQFSSNQAMCYSQMPPSRMMSYLDAEINVTGPGLKDFQVAGPEYEGKNYIEILNETDWTNMKVQERFQKAVNKKPSGGVQYCPANPDVFIPLKLGEIKKPYVLEDLCKKKESENPTGGMSDDPTGTSSRLVLTLGLLATITTICLLFPRIL